MQQESRIKQEEAFRQITQQNQDFELRRQRKQNGILLLNFLEQMTLRGNSNFVFYVY